MLRLVRYPRLFIDNMVDHLRGSGFVTAVAGTSVLGSQLVILAADYRVAMAFRVVAVALWIALTYTIFAAFTVQEHSIF